MRTQQNRTGKEDMRQRRSKHHLTQALLGLMEEVPYSELTVVDICQRAMVHRTTFYAHFEDKDDLFRYTLQDMMDRFSEEWVQTEKSGLRERIRDEFKKVLEFFHAHRRLQLVGLKEAGGPELQMMEEAIAGVLENFITEMGALDLWKENPKAAKVWGHFYAGAILTTVSWWLENDMPFTEEEMVCLLEKLLPGQM